MCKHAVKKLPHPSRHVLDQYKTQKICNLGITNPSTKYLKNVQNPILTYLAKNTDFSVSLAFKSIIESRII